MTSAVIVTLATHEPGLVEVAVLARSGMATVTPDEARALAAELLVQADRAENVVVPSLEAALGEGGG
jgi:cobalamin biosynthesis protein CbiG